MFNEKVVTKHVDCIWIEYKFNVQYFIKFHFFVVSNSILWINLLMNYEKSRIKQVKTWSEMFKQWPIEPSKLCIIKWQEKSFGLFPKQGDQTKTKCLWSVVCECSVESHENIKISRWREIDKSTSLLNVLTKLWACRNLHNSSTDLKNNNFMKTTYFVYKKILFSK